jgi:hypothetical protein
MEPTNEQLVEMYRRMVRIRRFEENVVEMVASGEIPEQPTRALVRKEKLSGLVWLCVPTIIWLVTIARMVIPSAREHS